MFKKFLLVLLVVSQFTFLGLDSNFNTVRALENEEQQENIEVKNISELSINEISNEGYTGEEIKPSVVITDEEYKLIEDKDYTLTYKNNTEVGTASVTIKGEGSYNGTKTITFQIVQKSISSLSFSTVSNKTYTDKQIKPSITIKNGNVTLEIDKDYTVSYGTNKKIGKATIKITGKGNYTGTKTITFYIVPKKVTIKSASTGDKKITVKWNKVTGASGYRIAYKQAGGSWKYTNVSSKTSSKTITGLTSNKNYSVKVAAYIKVGSKTVYGTYSNAKTVKVPDSSKAKKIVAVAKSKLGTPYKWGATGPNAFDCSGFTRYVYKQATGKTLPHNSSAQKSAGKVVSLSNVQVGDVVWRSGHVGIYVGNGQVIHSPHSGAVVSYTTLKGFKCAVRY